MMTILFGAILASLLGAFGFHFRNLSSALISHSLDEYELPSIIRHAADFDGLFRALSVDDDEYARRTLGRLTRFIIRHDTGRFFQYFSPNISLVATQRQTYYWDLPLMTCTLSAFTSTSLYSIYVQRSFPLRLGNTAVFLMPLFRFILRYLHQRFPLWFYIVSHDSAARGGRRHCRRHSCVCHLYFLAARHAPSCFVYFLAIDYSLYSDLFIYLFYLLYNEFWF